MDGHLEVVQTVRVAQPNQSDRKGSDTKSGQLETVERTVGNAKRKVELGYDDRVARQLQKSRQQVIGNALIVALPMEMRDIVVSFICYVDMSVGFVREEIKRLTAEIEKEEKLNTAANTLANEGVPASVPLVDTSFPELAGLQSVARSLCMQAVTFNRSISTALVTPARIVAKRSLRRLTNLKQMKINLTGFLLFATHAWLPVQAFEVFGQFNSYVYDCERFTVTDETGMFDPQQQKMYIASDSDESSDDDDNKYEGYYAATCFCIVSGAHHFISGHIKDDDGLCLSEPRVVSPSPILKTLAKYLSEQKVQGTMHRFAERVSDAITRTLLECLQYTLVFETYDALDVWKRLVTAKCPFNAAVLLLCIMRAAAGSHSNVNAHAGLHDNDAFNPFLDQYQATLASTTVPTSSRKKVKRV